MACIEFTPPPLPGVPGLYFAFATPAFSLNPDLCCHFSIFSLPAYNLPGIPLLGAALAVINAEIALVNTYVLSKKILSISCPLQ